ncbi:MAG: helix-turn-helix transcriptional regulator [Erysipelotrichaceae bacterium]
MNRTALSIKMLNALKAHGKLSKNELAQRLETNPRNIVEFKRELEIAGYHIESLPGRYGGYVLQEEDLLPQLALSEAQVKALKAAYEYIQSHPNFLQMDEFDQAIEKILGSTKTKADPLPLTFLSRSGVHVSAQIKTMMETVEQAIATQTLIELEYKSLQADQAQKLVVEPYRIVAYQEGYYLVAYAKQRQAFRTYKFSSTRMKAVQLLNKRFAIDPDFRLEQVIGSVGLIKQESYTLELVVTGAQAIFLSERSVGIELEKHEVDGKLYLKSVMEGKQSIVSFLLSLGAEVEVLQPQCIKTAYEETIAQMVAHIERK